MWGRSKKNPKQLVKGVSRLVSLPEVYVLVKERLQDARYNSHDIARVIGKDPDLTARLLRIANSAAYGAPRRIETVSRAVTVIGARDLEALVLASSAVEVFNRLPLERVSMASFWRHNVFTAVVARILARERQVLHPERLFVAGLLHDIGQLIIYHQLPEAAHELLDRTDPGKESCSEERALLGFDHAEVGGELAEAWQLPDALQAALRYHHEPGAAGEYALEAAMVHVADLISTALETKEGEELQDTCDITAWRTLGLAESRIKPIMQESLLEFIDVLDLLQPGARLSV